MLVAFGPTAEQNQLHFNVSLDGKPVGTYTARKVVVGDMETFIIETETAAGLIGRIAQRSVLKTAFQGDKLVSCGLQSWVNNNLESSSTIIWSNDTYVKQEKTVKTAIGNAPVRFSAARLFFEEPCGQAAVFHESYGKFLPLEKVNEHDYELKLPNGGTERYVYKDGMVSEVHVVRSFTTITIRWNFSS